MDDKNKGSDSAYDELLEIFDDVKIYDSKAKKTKPSEGLDSAVKRSEDLRKTRVQEFSLNIEGEEETPQYNGEVYFSNPPMPTKKAPVQNSAPAARQPQPKSAPSKKSKNPIKNIKFSGKGLFKTFSSLIIVLCIIIAASSAIIFYTITAANDILGIGREPVFVEVAIGNDETTKSVINILHDKDLLANKSFCKLFAKIFKIKDDGYTAGVYSLSTEMGLEKMLTKLKVASTSSETVALTFPEGWTVDQIADKLEKYEVCEKNAFLQTVSTTDFSEEFPFLEALDDKEKRFRALEGYMFPDTYEFYIGEAPSSVIRRFLKNFESKWSDEFAERAAANNMTVDDVLVIASIIEREAYSKSQMADISSVIHNRLSNSSEYPTLQCDSTSSYLQEYVKPVCTSEQYLAYVESYDTYSCYRYPVGAIANPGYSAIEAALYPSDTDYFFFMHDKNGDVYYAHNATQHRANNEKVWRINNS